MKLSIETANAKLATLPHLRTSMNGEWLDQFVGQEGWEIPTPVARWLVDGSSITDSYLVALNSVLARVERMRGGSERIRRLFQPRDLSNKWSILMELYVGAWLQSTLELVEFRSERGGGPDLLASGDGEQSLRIEVKSFQQEVFWSEVHDRLVALGRHHALHPRIRIYEEGRIPSGFEQELSAALCVLQSEEDRLTSKPDQSGEWRTYPALGFSVRWRRKLGGSVIESDLADGANPYGAFQAAFSQLTSGGRVKNQVKQADVVIVCFSKHTRSLDFNVLGDLLDSCDEGCQKAIYQEMPDAIREIDTLASVVCVAASLNQIDPFRTVVLDLPNASAEAKEKWKMFRRQLTTDAPAGLHSVHQ